MKICRTCKKEKEDTAFEITTVTATKTYRHGMCVTNVEKLLGR